MTGLLAGAVLAAAFTSAFERPDALHSTGFFWFWYDKLSSGKVAEQQEDLHAHGGDSLCVHPFPKSFRPGVQPSDMEPDYLTDGYFRLYGEVLDRAEKLGQTAWLYDEGGWPSGGACGRVYASDPERFGQRYMGPGCRVVRPDVDPSVSAPYPSVLEPGVTEKFLELTHEEYYRRFARHFGKTIRYAFTDEPGFGRKNREEWLPWCSDFANEFEARKHYSVKPYLEQLLTMTNADEKVARARVDYHDVLSQLFIERYARPVRTWCRSHGIGSGGHYGGEDEFSGNRRHGFGHILRALREMDAPGVDVIWRQLWPGDHRTRTPFAKYASSAAHQTGARDVMAEVFAIYGDGMTALQMKWVVDYLLVRGCNMFVLGYYQPCPPGAFMGGGGMHFGPSEPRWDDMSDFFSYMNRHSAALSQGEPVRKVAVFYDVRASWAGGEDCDRAEAAHLDVSRKLLERHCDFDYVDDDQLAAAEIVPGPRPALRIGKALYEFLVLPSSKWMQTPARSRLEDFRAQGGVVVEDEDGLGRIPAICRVRGGHADDIRVAKRMADGQAIYFFTNESMQPAEVEIQLDEGGSLSMADHRQGAFVPLASQGGTFRWSAPGAGSLLVLVGEKANGSARSVKSDGEILLDGEWEMAVRERVRPGLEKMEIERVENPSFTLGRLGDWRGLLGGEFSGKVIYRKRFASPWDGGAELDLGAVLGSAAVRVNGSEPLRLFLSPYRCPVSVRKGENVIEIEVANALVNAVFSPAFRKRLERQFPPRGKYEDYAEVFNREGHESGLIGPVRIFPAADGNVPLWRTGGLLPELEWGGATSDPEPAEKSDRFLPTGLADEPQPDAQVVYRDGLPKILLNGKLVEPILNMSDMTCKFALNQAAKMDAMGVTLNQIIFRKSDFEVGPGVYEFGRMNAFVRRMLKYAPHARILASIELELPKWTEAHPEAQVGYADGPAEGVNTDDHKGRAVRPSSASPEYRAEVRHFLEELGRYVASQPWGKRIVAVRPSWGIYREWHVYGMYHGPDCGPAMTAAFRRFRGGLHAHEDVPTLDERTLDEPFLFDPSAHRKLVDYYACMADVTADFLIETARTVKRVLPGRLVGVYYGYVLAVHPPEGATVLADKVLASGAIDFMSNPAMYTVASRRAGGSFYMRTIPETFHRYGKLMMIEDDMRHYHIKPFLRAHHKITTDGPREAEMTTRRNMLNAWFDGCGIQFLDCNWRREVRIFTHDAPEILQTICDVRDLAPQLGARAADSGNRTALVVDWRQRFLRPSNQHDEHNAVYVNAIEGFYASGVPADLMTLDDFLALPEERYSSAVFLNVFSATDDLRDRLVRRVAANGFRSVWMLRSAAAGEVREKVPTGGEEWRKLLTSLGAPAFAPSGHYVRRHGDRLMFHTGKAGRWTLTPSGYSGAHELFTNRDYAGESFEVVTDGPDTLVFQLEKGGR